MAFLDKILHVIRHPFDAKHYPVWNGLAFQIAWPACVLGGNSVAALVTLLLLAAHLCFSARPRLELKFILFSGLLGLAVDMSLIRTEILLWENVLPPLWMSCLWLLFGATIGHSFKWFEKRILLSSLFAGLFAPLSYLAGTRLTEVGLMSPEPMSLVIIGSIWSVLFPTFLVVHKRIVTRDRLASVG